MTPDLPACTVVGEVPIAVEEQALVVLSDRPAQSATARRGLLLDPLGAVPAQPEELVRGFVVDLAVVEGVDAVRADLTAVEGEDLVEAWLPGSGGTGSLKWACGVSTGFQDVPSQCIEAGWL